MELTNIVSFTWKESTPIVPILHLPWWDTYHKCIYYIVCDSKLEFISNSVYQKWCSKCYIVYTSCRYCKTSNIIFGITNQSQCKECNKISLITNMPDMTNIIKYFLKLNTCYYNQIANYVNNIGKNSNWSVIRRFIKKLNYFPLKVLHSHIANLVENNENPLNLIIPTIFIPFNNNEIQCHCCKEPYFQTSLFNQKYCKYCLNWYIRYATSKTDIRTTISNLNVCIRTTYTNCDKHEPRNLDFCIQEWCENCTEISYFKQIVTNQMKFDFSNMNHFFEKISRLFNDINEIKFCSDCYLISFSWIESTTTIPILYLPWWDTHSQCVVCDSNLGSKSDCQKWCSNCFIVFTGCRYCLTTNIIFGVTEQSQCIKCKRISLININVPDDMTNIGEYYLKFNTHNYIHIANYVSNIDKRSSPLEIYSFIKKLNYFPLNILYSHFANLIRNNENSLSLTIPIIFIPFSNKEIQCHCCKETYSQTPLFNQKYCKNCLNWYIKYATSKNADIRTAISNLDACVRTTYTNCDKHEPRNLDFCIQEWCENCSEILYFRQIVVQNQQIATTEKFDLSKIDHFFEKNCKLCGKLIYKLNDDITKFKLCLSCYLISLEFIESTLTKEHILILHLPWWEAYNECIVCDSQLELTSNCQKWGPKCFIVYTGCRYCLTTNIIFGFIDQSQCKKCYY